MTESDIQFALGRHFFLKKICIPNVSMYCVGKTEYEADFIYFDVKDSNNRIRRRSHRNMRIWQ